MMNYKKNLVSIIIATYNHKEFIDETLSSVVGQTYKDIEIIVCDDCSSDGCKDKILEWSQKDIRIIPILAEKNEGLSANINKGLDRATGEYIAFLGGDDMMCPQKLEKQVKFLSQNMNYDVVLHWVDVFDTTSRKVLFKFDSGIVQSPDDWFLAARSFGFFKKRWNSNFPHIAYLARASYAQQSRWDFRLRYKNEILFTIDNFMKKPNGKWYCIPEILGVYRIHENNMHKSKDMNETLLEETYVNYILASARYPSLQPKLKRVLIHFLYDRYYYYLVTDKARKKDDLRKSRAQLINEAGFFVYCYAYIYLRMKQWYHKVLSMTKKKVENT